MSNKNNKTLKPGWRRVKFGEVVRQCKEKADPETSGLERYIAGDHMDTDDLRVRRWGEIGSGYLGPAFNIRFKPGQVLYGSRRTYLRKVAVADFEGICANTTLVLEPINPNDMMPGFLPFLMQSEAFTEYSINRPLKKCSSNAPGSRISKKQVAQTRLRNECEGHFGLFAGRFARFGRTYPMAHA